jgi:hypothetical protein
MAWTGKTFYLYVTVEECLPSVGIKIAMSNIMLIAL